MDLIAGPWIGEFGWELMSWQAYLRALVHQHKFDHVTIFGPPGHDILYSDFTDVYVPAVLDGIKDCWKAENVDPLEKTLLFQQINRLIKPYTSFICPVRSVPITEQRFIVFGNAQNVLPAGRFDVLVHVRKPINKRPSHAWGLAHAEEVCQYLTERGLSVAAIGTASECPRGVVNRLNIPLKDLMDLIAAAGVVIGPSSGPMHLASLCRTPHLVWTDRQWYSAIKATNKERYKSIWNPFNTPCIILEGQGPGGWQPDVDLVTMKTEDAIKLERPPIQP